MLEIEILTKKLNKYQMYLLFSKKISEEVIDMSVNKFTDIIKSNGEIKKIDKWGSRKFAFPVEKETEGIYIMIDFEGEPQVTIELNRVGQIMDGLFRILILKKDD